MTKYVRQLYSEEMLLKSPAKVLEASEKKFRVMVVLLSRLLTRS